jgi:D-alanine-D-alanine ligase
MVKTLKSGGHDVKAMEIKKADLDNILKDVKNWADVVFNLTEGVGLHLVLEVIKKLEELEIPFAGASYFGHKLTSDKALVKETFKANNIPTPVWKIYFKDNLNEEWTGNYPAIVKATTEHGSMSIHQDAVVKNKADLKKQVSYLLEKYHGIPVLAEEYIEGREINSTVIGSFSWAKCLPLSEVIFKDFYKKPGVWPIYTYEAKYNHGGQEFKDAPSQLVDWMTEEEVKNIEEMTLRICAVTECFDYARTDIRFDIKKRIPYFIDLNSYPCLLDDPIDDTITVSRLAAGWDYLKILEEIAVSGIKRNKMEENK